MVITRYFQFHKTSFQTDLQEEFLIIQPSDFLQEMIRGTSKGEDPQRFLNGFRYRNSFVSVLKFLSHSLSSVVDFYVNFRKIFVGIIEFSPIQDYWEWNRMKGSLDLSKLPSLGVLVYCTHH